MNNVFVNNIGDLSEAPRASFYRMVKTGLMEEFENFQNPFPAQFKLKVPEQCNVKISTFVYLFPNEVKLKGPNLSFKECLEQDLTFAIQLFVHGEYCYYLDEKCNPYTREKAVAYSNLLAAEQEYYTFFSPIETIDKKIKECILALLISPNLDPNQKVKKTLNEIRKSKEVNELAELQAELTKVTKKFELIQPDLQKKIEQCQIELGLTTQDELDDIKKGKQEYPSVLKKRTAASLKKEKIQAFRIFQDIFFGEIPLMTEEGTFLVTGCERVVISQIIRSPGVYFRKEFGLQNKTSYTATIISNKGLWTKFILDLQVPKKEKKKKILFEDPPLLERIYMEMDEFRGKNDVSKRDLKKEDNDVNRIYIFELIEYFGLTLAEICDSLKYPWYTNELNFLRKPAQKDLRFQYQRLEYIKRMFLNLRSGCFSIGEIGRYKINKKLGLNLPKDIGYLTAHDFIGIMDGLFELKYHDRLSDDIDHIKNKQIRSAGELIQNQIKIGLYRLERNILENKTFNKADQENFALETLSDIEDWVVDPRPLTSAVKEFFKTSQLSQYMDQVNPLAELTHKRRVSVFGPNGLKRDHISTVIRDIHPSQYGRLCPVETSEGQNAGLVMSLSLYGRISSFGWIETPYFYMEDGKVFSNKEPIFLNPEQESETKIAFGDLALTKEKKITTEYISTKENYIFSSKKIEEVQFLTTSPLQVVSLAAALIPFLEHNDANRALMGSNMQRQAVPLLYPQKPIIGTGFEPIAILDSGMIIKNYCQGVVNIASAEYISVIDSENQHIRYYLQKYIRSNQETASNQRPIVWPGEEVFSGQIIADGPGTHDGELALGKNITIAYMPWEGYNYEDAIVINERMILDNSLTSVHIEEHETTITHGITGSEYITNSIPYSTFYSRRNLTEEGIVKIGSYVKEYDILVGKIIQYEENQSPEARLIKALYGREKPKFRDISFTVPPGTEGRVVDVRIVKTSTLLKEEDTEMETFVLPKPVEETNFLPTKQPKKYEKWSYLLALQRFRQLKKKIPQAAFFELEKLLQNKNKIKDKENSSSSVISSNLIEKIAAFFKATKRIRHTKKKREEFNNTGKHAEKNPNGLLRKLRHRFSRFQKANQKEKIFFSKSKFQFGSNLKGPLLQLKELFLLEKNLDEVYWELKKTPRAKEEKKKGELQEFYDDSFTTLITIKIYIAQVRKIQIGDKLSGRHGNKGIVSRILARQDMPYLPDGTPIDILFNPLGVPSRMNVGQIFECLLGLAGEKLGNRYKISPFDEIYGEEASRILVNQKLKQASIKTDCNWLFHPLFPGKILLRDGRTGDYFDNPITVGKSYILKLIHLVEDKIHSRATGPYSMITEQPLAGKSQKGGQRFGEMEVWAIEAYGCSNTLQELLTIKSDDIDGRNDMYEALVIRQGMEKPNPSLPESFSALIRELNCLGLDFSIGKFEGGFYSTTDTKDIEKDLFFDLENRLKLRALLGRKKAEQFTLPKELKELQELKTQSLSEREKEEKVEDLTLLKESEKKNSANFPKELKDDTKKKKEKKEKKEKKKRKE